MKVHLVSGFLGSGKTTAIISAAKYFMQQGKRVGVITNDQGKYLVDTEFVRLNDIPAVEVNGGCFCCNYHDFNDSLEKLTGDLEPDLIFAESVGSCADIVATVVKPLLDFKTTHAEDTSLTTFTDSRLLHAWLKGEELPFQDNVIYIFEQQMEEAGMLVINKIDLIASDKLAETRSLLAEKFPQKIILAMNSLSAAGVQPWLEQLQIPASKKLESVNVDYQTYGSGEQQLAWYDAKIRVSGVEGAAISAVQRLFNQIASRIRKSALPVGHIKFLLRDGEKYEKYSLVTVNEDALIEIMDPFAWGNSLDLVINARVETSASELKNIIHQAIQKSFEDRAKPVILEEDAFHPGFPKPEFRIS